MSQEDEDDQEPVEEDSEDYQKAYLNSIIDLQRQYILRNKNVVVDPPKKALEGKASTSQPRREVVQQKPRKKDFPKVAPPKEKELPKESIPKEKDLQME